MRNSTCMMWSYGERNVKGCRGLYIIKVNYSKHVQNSFFSIYSTYPITIFLIQILSELTQPVRTSPRGIPKVGFLLVINNRSCFKPPDYIMTTIRMTVFDPSKGINMTCQIARKWEIPRSIKFKSAYLLFDCSLCTRVIFFDVGIDVTFGPTLDCKSLPNTFTPRTGSCAVLDMHVVIEFWCALKNKMWNLRNFHPL